MHSVEVKLREIRYNCEVGKFECTAIVTGRLKVVSRCSCFAGEIEDLESAVNSLTEVALKNYKRALFQIAKGRVVEQQQSNYQRFAN